jgi:hypothetical protein
MALKKQQQEILFFMLEKLGEWLAPTLLGQAVGGKKPTSASSWGSSNVKPLVNEGFVEAKDGQYRLTEKGVNAAQVLKDIKKP